MQRWCSWSDTQTGIKCHLVLMCGVRRGALKERSLASSFLLWTVPVGGWYHKASCRHQLYALSNSFGALVTHGFTSCLLLYIRDEVADQMVHSSCISFPQRRHMRFYTTYLSAMVSCNVSYALFTAIHAWLLHWAIHVTYAIHACVLS